jgi:small GTP-binding protein
MRKLVIGILAHVDAGKTTLSEGMLYLGGSIRKLGRVDKQDAFLDNYQLERERGITIFSKQAMLEYGDTQITLLDTPGHVDFSTEMERTLQVLDYAILVISASDGVQGHTKTLWQLLKTYNLPVFLFINKMDQNENDKDKLMKHLKEQLSEGCVDFTNIEAGKFNEELVMCSEELLESYLEKEYISEGQIKMSIKQRRVFPCFFGSALKLEGVEELMDGIVKYSCAPIYNEAFGARVFKISRDEQGNRLTHMKLTGGKLKVKDMLNIGIWEEKVNQIRIYSGQRFEAANEIGAGSVCAVTGLNYTKAGEGLGSEHSYTVPILESVLSYQIILPEGCDPRVMLPKLRQIEEEDPELHIIWDEKLQEIQVQIMGQVQIEILQSLIMSRFGIEVSFDSGRILYKESIDNVVEGVGHFEPLRHYAEVHLLLEPGIRGSGLVFKTNCSDDVLSKNWKSLIMTHLNEKTHKGVLIGADITDMVITLVSGRAHIKHTEGGDFREATYRAVRQGLREANSILLEPYYNFQLELPKGLVGRAMSDIERMYGEYRLENTDRDIAIITGSAPVVTMRNYQSEVTAYTRGQGRFFCSLKGYGPCHNAEEIIESAGYDPEGDLGNPTGSVFCGNGGSFVVSWDHVKEHMHLLPYLKEKRNLPVEESKDIRMPDQRSKWIDPDEVDRILNKSSYANQGKKYIWSRQKPPVERVFNTSSDSAMSMRSKDEYLLVDGYNVIYAWPELNELTKDSMEGARAGLLDCLSKYKGICKCEIIVVFDAYLVQGHKEEIMDYNNIHVVYTREAQTADQYIEKFAHDNSKRFHITVATSDGLQQIIIRGAGCALLSSRELKKVIDKANEGVMKEFIDKQPNTRETISDVLNNNTKKQMEKLIKDNKPKSE